MSFKIENALNDEQSIKDDTFLSKVLELEKQRKSKGTSISRKTKKKVRIYGSSFDQSNNISLTEFE